MLILIYVRSFVENKKKVFEGYRKLQGPTVIEYEARASPNRLPQERPVVTTKKLSESMNGKRGVSNHLRADLNPQSSSENFAVVISVARKTRSKGNSADQAMDIEPDSPKYVASLYFPFPL